MLFLNFAYLCFKFYEYSSKNLKIELGKIMLKFPYLFELYKFFTKLSIIQLENWAGRFSALSGFSLPKSKNQFFHVNVIQKSFCYKISLGFSLKVGKIHKTHSKISNQNRKHSHYYSIDKENESYEKSKN